MKRILFSSALFVLALAAITLHSCKKEDADTETQSAVDNNICESEFTKMMPRINNFGINEQGVKSMASACPAITVTDTSVSPGWPRTLTIDYGTGCVDSIDGKTRTGQIICEFSYRWHYVGTYVKITLVNFSVNGMAITIDSMKITHSALNAFNTKVFNGKCSTPSWNLEWACDRTITQTGGIQLTPPFNPYDDVFELTGSATGKNRDAKGYTVNITTPIVKRSSCSWIESGKMDLTPDGLATRTVDFGQGTCDNQATLIINGNSFAFTMN